MTYPTGHISPFHFDMALQAPVFAMEERGILIDLDERERLHERYHLEWEKAQTNLNGLVGYAVNINSHKQVKALLYGALKLKGRKKFGKLTGNEDAIRSMLAETDAKMSQAKLQKTRMKWLRANLILSNILTIRGIRKRISSYIDIEHDDDNRMRSTISVGATETGRFNSSKTLWGTGCNLQTIPRELRSMFIAPEGMVLAEFDLNRGESWIYSHLSEDYEMMEIHQTGGDFHAETAAAVSSVFGRERVAKEIEEAYENGEEWAYKLRYLGKKTNHASAYRMGPYRFVEVVNAEADDTNITIISRQAKAALQLWKDKYFRVPQWWVMIEKRLNEARTLETPFGRKRTFHNFWGEELFKEATAYVPQSTSVDFLNCGMLNVYHELDQKDAFGIKLLHQNHDSILVEFPEDQIQNAFPAIIEAISRTSIVIKGYLTGTKYDISIPVDGTYGPSWGQQEGWAG